MKRIALLSFILCTFCTCTTKNTSSELIKVDNTEFRDWWSLMEIDEVVTFQDTASAPKLSIANKCIVGKEQLLFWDYRTKLVYAYDTRGKYLFTVGGIGRSDSEYVGICDVAYSLDQNEIHILDETGIKVYDSRTGRFLKKQKIRYNEGASIKGFLPCENDTYLLFTPDNEYSISKIDNEGNMIPLRKRNGYQMIYNRFTFANGKVVVLPDYGNFTIDQVKDNKIMPAYTVDINSSLPADMVPNDYNSFVQVDDMRDYFKVLLDYYENNNYLYASIVGPNQTYYDLIYDKSKRKVYAGPHDEETNIVFTGMDNDYLYGLIYLDYIKPESQFCEFFRPFMEAGNLNPLFIKIKMKRE